MVATWSFASLFCAVIILCGDFTRRHACAQVVLPSSLFQGISDSEDVSSKATCTASQYYDESVLGCNQCVGGLGAATISNPQLVPATNTAEAIATSCTCKLGSIWTARTSSGCDATWPAPCNTKVCASCPSGSVPSQDSSQCMECGNSTLGLSELVQECKCATNSVLVDKNQTGEYLNAKECVACLNGTYADATSNTCRPCPDPAMVLTNTSGDLSCECSTGYEQLESVLMSTTSCVSSSQLQVVKSKVDLSSAVILQFSDFSSAEAEGSSASVSITSNLYQDIFSLAAFRCYFYTGEQHGRYCQALGNLCTLQHFSPSAPSCSFFDLIQRSGRSTVANSINGWYYTLPFLSYSSVALGVEEDASIKMQMSFDESSESGTSDHLDFALAKYHVNGTLAAFEKLANQLSYCSSANAYNSMHWSPLWLRFGVSQRTEFSCDLTALIGSPLFLYELFLVDKTKADGDSGRYVPIPIRVLNYRDGNGAYVNQNSDTSSDFLSHRFFLFDSQSGVSVGQTAARVIRYAQSITLTVKSQSADTKLIYPPILTINYVDTQLFTSAPVSFNVVYTSSTSSFWSFAVSLLVVASIVAACRVFLQTYNWQRRSTRNEEVANAILQSVAFVTSAAMANTAAAVFITLLVLCTYFLLFFKLQASVYVLMPELQLSLNSDNTDEYRPFRIALVLAFLCQLVSVLHVTYRQTQIRLFFIDWEKPRATIMDLDSNAPQSAPVSIWRTILVANEWTELQTMRRTSLVLTLVVMLFLLYGCDLRTVALPIPLAQMDYYYATTASNSLSPASDDILHLNPVLRFANVAWWWIFTCAAQRIWRWAIYERYIDEPRENLFIDLCTVAKVSCLFLDEPYHGFYLHCRSPHPFADGSMEEIVDQFRQEEAGLTVGRHLDVTVPDCQTFEVFVTRKWNRKFKTLLNAILGEDQLAEEKAAAQRRLHRSRGGVRPRSGVVQATSTLLSWGTQMHQHHGAPATSAMVTQAMAMSDFLKGFIENQHEAFRWRIYRAHTCFTRSLGIPPDMSISRQSLFIPDTNAGFAKAALFLGVENDLMLLNILCFSVFDLWLDSHATSAFATFVLESILVALRARYGARNVARNTLVDPRFLI